MLISINMTKNLNHQNKVVPNLFQLKKIKIIQNGLEVLSQDYKKFNKVKKYLIIRVINQISLKSNCNFLNQEKKQKRLNKTS